jgi:hypothetical protein
MSLGKIFSAAQTSDISGSQARAPHVPQIKLNFLWNGDGGAGDLRALMAGNCAGNLTCRDHSIEPVMSPSIFGGFAAPDIFLFRGSHLAANTANCARLRCRLIRGIDCVCFSRVVAAQFFGRFSGCLSALSRRLRACFARSLSTRSLPQPPFSSNVQVN